MEDLYQQWAEAFEAVGACHLSFDTCAKLLAVVYVYGGSHSDYTLNPKLRADYNAAARRFRVQGGESPDPEAVAAIQAYVSELMEDIHESKAGEDESAVMSKVCHVKWALELMSKYGINKILL